MKKFNKVLSLLLVLAMMMSLVACGGNKTTETTAPAAEAETEAPAEVVYERGDDEEVYDVVLGDYDDLVKAAEALEDPDERFVLFAQAEAALLDGAVFLPCTTQGGRFQISRVAPRTIPYVQWGNDDDRLKGLVISDEFISKEERADLMDMWNKAMLGEAEYDPEAYLTGKGHTITKDYTYTFSTAPVTLDWLNTSSQSDTEITVNCVDGLVEYDNLGTMNPALAESWEISEDGTVYTFHIRPNVYWYTAEGTEYAEVTANDFVAGLHHMLDTQAGLEWLLDGVVVGATDYYANGGSWDDVGYKATDDYTLVVTLEKPIPYFMTMLTYSCFLPICQSFYEANGGVYGTEEFAEASADDTTYTYGKTTDVSSQVYCGPFLLQKLEKDSEILVVANPGYYNKDTVKLNSIKWVYDNGEDMVAFYNDTVSGVYSAVNVSMEATRKLAEADGNFEKYSYVTDTTSTTYFGGLNVNRGSFALESGAVASTKTEQEKIDTVNALRNKNFRKAVLYAIDKETINATRNGAEAALYNLRNMYCHPEFVKLSKDMTDSFGYTFPAGTLYGDMVQHYCDEIGMGIDVHDGVNGWFQPEAAKEYLATAMDELGDTIVEYPIQIDVTYYSASDILTAEAHAYKESIESTLGADKVQVNLVEATTSEDYYASGYRAPNGEAGNFDLFYGSGWGPDYGDPSTYLDTMLGGGSGYMTKVLGLF